jgi:hypothetical protein
MNEKITMYDYLASKVPSDAYFVLNKFSKYRRARNEKELSYQLRDFVRTFGEKAINELALIHPDRKLLEINCEECKRKNNIKQERLSNFIEEKELLGEKELLSKTNNSTVPVDEKTSKSEMLILSGLILISIALIVKK